MTIVNILDARLAENLAYEMLVGGVAEIAPPSQAFNFRGGMLSPIKFLWHRAFNDPVLRRKVFGNLDDFRVRRLIAKSTGVNLGDLICLGVPNGGVPWAAALAETLAMPYRLTTKARSPIAATDLMSVEELPEGVACFGFEDMTTTGGSFMKLRNKVSDGKSLMRGGLTLGEYGFDEATASFAEMEIDLHILMPWCAQRAAMGQFYTKEIIGRIDRWRRDPWNWDPLT